MISCGRPPMPSYIFYAPVIKRNGIVLMCLRVPDVSDFYVLILGMLSWRNPGRMCDNLIWFGWLNTNHSFCLNRRSSLGVDKAKRVHRFVLDKGFHQRILREAIGRIGTHPCFRSRFYAPKFNEQLRRCAERAEHGPIPGGVYGVFEAVD